MKNNLLITLSDLTKYALITWFIIFAPFGINVLYGIIFNGRDTFEMGVGGTLLFLLLFSFIFNIAYFLAYLLSSIFLRDIIQDVRKVYFLILISLLTCGSVFINTLSNLFWHLAERVLFFFLPDLLAIGCVYFLFYLFLITLYFFIKKHMLLYAKKS